MFLFLLQVRANVAKVDIKPFARRCVRIREKASYPLNTFLSDLGGVFGLYLNIDCLTICILFQVLYRVYKIVRQNYRRQNLKIQDVPQIVKHVMTRG